METLGWIALYAFLAVDAAAVLLILALVYGGGFLMLWDDWKHRKDPPATCPDCGEIVSEVLPWCPKCERGAAWFR